MDRSKRMSSLHTTGPAGLVCDPVLPRPLYWTIVLGLSTETPRDLECISRLGGAHRSWSMGGHTGQNLEIRPQVRRSRNRDLRSRIRDLRSRNIYQGLELTDRRSRNETSGLVGLEIIFADFLNIQIVGLRTLLLRKMVFTLYLMLFLDYVFLRNPMVPTTFWKKVPNMPIFGPRVGQIKKALLFDINNIFSIKNQQLLCIEIRLIHWYSFKNHRQLINVSNSKMAVTTSK